MVSKQASKTPTAEMALRLYLDELESRLEEADTAYADTQWREHFGQTGHDELGRLEVARAALLLDNHVRETLSRWEGRSRDPALARRVTLLSRRFRWAEIESRPEIYELRNRIDGAILAFRPHDTSLPGILDQHPCGIWGHGKPISRADRAEILRRDPDRARRRDAWLAMGPLSTQIETDVRELMRRREGLARALGYDGFVSWALGIAGLNRQWVEALFDKLRRLTDTSYHTWLTKATQRLSLPDRLRPWDLAFAAEGVMSLPDEAFASDRPLLAVQAVADGLGLGQQAAGVRVDVADVPYAALCYAVHPPDDVRILLNSRDGHVYNILFHEFGHALHWRCLRPTSPAFCWEPPPFNEAMACLWERLAWEPDWLIEREGITPDQAATHRQGWIERTIYRLRAIMAQATFEHRAFQNLEGDLLGLFRDTQAEYLGVSFDQAPGWADSPFWTSHPVYLQNYVIAQVVASQTLATLRRRFDRLIGEPGIGAWLVENYYGPGASLPWIEKVARATGASPSSADLVADLGCEGGERSAIDLSSPNAGCPTRGERL